MPETSHKSRAKQIPDDFQKFMRMAGVTTDEMAGEINEYGEVATDTHMSSAWFSFPETRNLLAQLSRKCVDLDNEFCASKSRERKSAIIYERKTILDVVTIIEGIAQQSAAERAKQLAQERDSDVQGNPRSTE